MEKGSAQHRSWAQRKQKSVSFLGVSRFLHKICFYRVVSAVRFTEVPVKNGLDSYMSDGSIDS